MNYVLFDASVMVALFGAADFCHYKCVSRIQQVVPPVGWQSAGLV